MATETEYPAAWTNHPAEDDSALDVTWARAARIWWSLAWRGIVFGALAGFVAGFVLSFALTALGTNRELIAIGSMVISIVVGIPVGIWVVRNVLRKTWSGFRIALLRA